MWAREQNYQFEYGFVNDTVLPNVGHITGLLHTFQNTQST